MAERITLDQLKSYLWNSAVLLRTHIDAGAYKQYIFPLMFFKRICDVYDEETEIALAKYGEDIGLYPEEELHRFIIPEGQHWRDVRQVTEDVGAAIVKAFREIEKANGEKMTGIFGDGAWTNKNRLPDRLLRDLLEHFSSLNLSLENCPEDELGQGYEYLIKQFADDSGHTAQEFYTNRTVVHLMTEILEPQSGESVYDPTCGSAGMLISCIAHLKDQGKEWRNLQVYGQEINQLTSAIGRMNLFLHGIEDFHIVNDDTLKKPAFIENGQLKKFDLVLANPPYSISQWDRAAFENDKYGRNRYGTPPQSRADYAFIQHIIASLKEETGRAAILLPHGVLNRNEEKEIRKAIIQSDCIDTVIGLGRHLFYNSGLESCIMVLRKNKSAEHRGSILFIEAEKCTHKVQAQNYLFDEDIAKITDAYFSETDIPDFSKRISIEEILQNEGNLNIKLYVSSDPDADDTDFADALDDYLSVTGFVSDQGVLREQSVLEHKEYTVRFDDFDRSQWQRVKLSDVAEEYAERIDDPSASDYEWYIGSDCIDGFGFRISRKQPAEKIHSAQKLFKAGDYLLVRRSLYGSDFRERAPRADFDGICSADILTIREKPGTIVDGYLIAVLYSKQLWKFIVSNSTGSLTRRIKWNQLKDFEFDLPPVEFQKYMVDLLWAIERSKDAYKALMEKSDELVKSQFLEMFGSPRLNEKGLIRQSLGEMAELQLGKMVDAKKQTGSCSFPYLANFNVRWFEFDLSELRTMDFDEKSAKKFELQDGDLIACEGGEVCRCAVWHNNITSCFYQKALYRIRCNKTIIFPEYLARVFYYWWQDNQFEDVIGSKATILHMPSDKLKALQIPVPPLNQQAEYLGLLQQIDKSKLEANQALESLNAMQKSLMRKHLAGE